MTQIEQEWLISLPMSKARLALFPFAIFYDCITRFKNYLYNKKILSSSSFDIPIIVIGNLAIGGTGKTPHTEFMANFLKSKFAVAVLSRGYGRKTKGYLSATSASTSQQIGDEPLQIFNSVSGIDVAVCEDRTKGVNELIQTKKPEVIILDDAFQHRKITGSLYILLTTYSKMFYDDFVLPAGDLREASSNKNRADIIIVSKCPADLGFLEKKIITEKIGPKPQQKVYFSCIKYLKPKIICGGGPWQNNQTIVLVTGVVNPQPLKDHLEKMGTEVQLMKFADHHNYTDLDVLLVEEKLKTAGKNSVLVTTSKDAVKLKPLIENKDIHAYEIPIQIEFLFQEENDFSQYLIEHVRKV